MNILILGHGVIGSIYGYIFQKNAHHIRHLLRDNPTQKNGQSININMLDGRYNKKGKSYSDNYQITLADELKKYDLIILSVGSGKLKSAVQTLRANHIQGTILLFCNFWFSREEINQLMTGFEYIIAFPVAGGRMNSTQLDCALFNHIMMDRKQNACAHNYNEIEQLFASVDIKVEKPHDMIDWIKIHMAINAGVGITAAQNGSLDNPSQLATNLMNSAATLSNAIICIRETLNIVASLNVNMKYYANELMPYKLPAKVAGLLMKRLFHHNELTRRIMTLHSDVNDILYGCDCLYQAGKQHQVMAPHFYEQYEAVRHLNF